MKKYTPSLIILFFLSFYWIGMSQNELTEKNTSSYAYFLDESRFYGEEIQKNYLIGKINYAEDERFVKIDPRLTNKETYLRKEVYEAFLAMNEQAKRDGIELIILSGARNFNHQKYLWENKWNSKTHLKAYDRALDILRYSSMPMSSRHHWGTDIDLKNLNNAYFESGEGLKIYEWLQNNAHNYGFCQVYTDKNINNRTGYEMERWHWSYMPLAKRLLECYNEEVSPEDFSGFKGSETAEGIGIIKRYVNGIADCF